MRLPQLKLHCFDNYLFVLVGVLIGLRALLRRSRILEKSLKLLGSVFVSSNSFD